MRIIKSHGLNWAVEAQGFPGAGAGAENDMERGYDAIETALDALPSERAAALHAANMAWCADDCAETRPDGFDSLEMVGHAAATEGWHRPEAVSYAVNAWGD